MSDRVKRPPGRPRLTDRKPSDGRPKLQLRLEPDLHAWASERGSAYLRDLITAARAFHERGGSDAPSALDKLTPPQQVF